jgi:membrane protease YdiL (CAAX protease family)
MPAFQMLKSGWAYPQEPMQRPLRAILIFILLFVVFSLLQAVMALLAYRFLLGGSLVDLGTAYQSAREGGGALPADSPVMGNFLKAMVIGMTPAGLLSALFARFMARYGLPQRQGHLPLGKPQINILQWIAILVVFVIAMGAIFNLIFWIAGIDPSTYETSAKGLSDAQSKAGLVEKTLADLARDPKLFVFAIPGVVIGAPFAEEFIFRGGLFAGLKNSFVGAPGAIIITAALWALAHGQAAPWMFIGVLFVMGLVLGLLLLRFGSLWVTIICHVLWNAISSGIMFYTGTHS